MNLGSFGVKFGSNLAPKGQKFTKRTREPNETIFPHSFKYLVLILHKNCQFQFLGACLGLFGVKIGSNLAPKGQKCTKRTREPNETIFLHSFKYWVWFLHKNFQFWFLGAYLGLFWVKIGPQRPKNQLIGQQSQMSPFFRTVLSTEYASFMKITNFEFQVPIWIFLYQKKAQRTK